MVLWDEAARTNLTRPHTRDLFHRLTCNLIITVRQPEGFDEDGWQVSVSPTLVESELIEAVLVEG